MTDNIKELFNEENKPSIEKLVSEVPQSGSETKESDMATAYAMSISYNSMLAVETLKEAIKQNTKINLHEKPDALMSALVTADTLLDSFPNTTGHDRAMWYRVIAFDLIYKLLMSGFHAEQVVDQIFQFMNEHAEEIQKDKSLLYKKIIDIIFSIR